ncbi:MAG TPA: septum formation initiator, partial [Firmicutes bacterium]|nr:septum formation initiator [Bacillota bacterium]
ENTLHNSIIVAQETAEDVKRNASKEAELIRKEAEKEAQRIVEEARYKASRILAEHEEVYKQAQIFKLRFRAFIEAQLASLELEDWLQVDNEEEHEARDIG